MKSSTLRRSNLSRERMVMLEELARRRRQAALEDSASASAQPAREKELDVLWENFKVNQRAERSPGVYLATGFIAGAVAMLVITTLLSFTVKKVETSSQSYKIPKETVKKEKLTFIPSDNQASQGVSSAAKSETYTVKDGDTLEAIIIRFYGSYGLDKVEKIRQANNMTNPNALSIGQTLVIPMEQ